MMTTTRIRVFDDVPPSLGEAQKIVGGFVELVRLPDGSQMLVNEDGRALDVPVNREASELAGQMILGSVAILTGAARWH